MAPLGPTTNVVIVTKIPEGVTEQQVSQSAGGFNVVLSLSYRPADLDGPGWALLTFANPELARVTRERLHGKPLPVLTTASTPIEANLGEGLYGPVRRAGDSDGPWREARTEQGQLYYYHAVTRQTTWVKPAIEFPGLLPGAAGLAVGARTGVGVPPPGQQIPGRPGVVVTLPPPQQGAAQLTAQAVANQAAQVAAAASLQQMGGVDVTLGAAQGPFGSNLFIYHIPNSWDDQIMRQHFEHFGTIISCRVQKDPEGRPRGFGFVSFSTPEAAQAAIAGMHGFPVDGKHLKVQLKKGDTTQVPPGAPGTAPAPALGLGGDLSGLRPIARPGPY